MIILRISMYMYICMCIYSGLLDAKSLSSSVIKSLETGVDIGDTQSTLRQYENDRYIKNLGNFFESKIMCLASSSLNYDTCYHPHHEIIIIVIFHRPHCYHHPS